MNSKEKVVVDEEEDDCGRQLTGESSCAASQNLFMTPLQSSQYRQLSTAAATASFWTSPSTPTEHSSQIRRRKKRTQDDTFSKILQANAASDCEHRAWRMNMAASLEKERIERKEAQESQQEKGREMHQDAVKLFSQQTDAVDFVEPVGSPILGSPPSAARGELGTGASLYHSPNVPHGIWGCCTILTTQQRRTLKTFTASHILTCESHSWCICS
ncbi:vesicle-associated membrane protein-associated protein B/C isoform X3 [Mauremys mutica]|uniref:vesicle-associated membrane protein-associated protein B/C isoform X3 n=1 Tax=Mauremys mutica TaxID=74926 RepID=UPI001D16B996|nr:vesicle-associated membrane protein-associated protein B/C isoform X3 [Mauremys mutica]